MKIIAEIGWNFMGDHGLFREMVVAAREDGADLIKGQFWQVKNLKPGPWDSDGRKEIYRAAELSNRSMLKCMEICSELSMPYFVSVFSLRDAEIVKKNYGFDSVKIPSHEVRNTELLEYCLENFNLVFASYGAALEEEVYRAAKIYKRVQCAYEEFAKLIPMHCVSKYPVDLFQCRLRTIGEIREIFQTEDIGLSDHSLGSDIGFLLGTEKIAWLEKHFTIDQQLPGRDNKNAALPGDLSKLKRKYELARAAWESKPFVLEPEENDIREYYSGRWSG